MQAADTPIMRIEETHPIPPHAPPLMLKLDEVARLCGVSRKTVTRWIASDGLPVHRLPGTGCRGIALVSPDDLKVWLAKHRHVEATDTPTLQLDGRRFIQHGGLASAAQRCSRVGGQKGPMAGQRA